MKEEKTDIENQNQSNQKLLTEQINVTIGFKVALCNPFFQRQIDC